MILGICEDKNMLLTKEVPIIIYGAGEVGFLCAESLKKKGYNVFAALDQNKENVDLIEGVPVFKFGNEALSDKMKNEILVVICLADGMLHKKIADSLYQRGYRHLVFLPMRHSVALKRKRELTDFYNKLLIASDELEKKAYQIEGYELFCYPELTFSDAILSEEAESYTVYVGMELLFSENVELWKGDRNKFFTKEEYKDKNIAAQYRNESLWDYFSLKEDNCDEYFKGFKKEKTEEERKKELEKREELYSIFQTEYDKGLDFFIQAAPYVTWNPKHYFNLIGGHHRIMFLLSKGHTLFPVRMKKSDFELWSNKDAFEDLKQFLQDNAIEKTYAPIPHPAMISFPSKCGSFGKNKLKSIFKFFGLQSLNQFTVLDISNGEGYFARNMLRCGVASAEYRADDVQAIELTRKINRLMYINNMGIGLGRLSDEFKKFDIVFAMDSFGCLSERKDLVMIADKLSQMTNRYLFIELCSDDDNKYLLAHTGFSNYTVLYEEYRKGRIWKIFVYRK